MPYRERIVCIYKVTSPTGKIYIGQTCNYLQRIVMYRNALCHKQRKLFYSLKKHGFDNHKMEILELCDEYELNEREMFYINKYNSFDTEHGLNLSSGGNGSGRMSEETKRRISEGRLGEKHHNYGKKASIETRIKLSNAHRGKIVGIETREKLRRANTGKRLSEKQKKAISDFWTGKIGKECKNSIPITQYKTDGTFVKEWDCTQDLKRAFGWNPRNISSVCRGERSEAHGFVWRFKRDRFDKYKYVHPKNKKKSIIQLNKDGSFIKEWSSLIDAANGLGVMKYSIFNCLSGKSNSAFGYKWEYK